MEVYKKLLSVQSELKCSKSQHNSFGNYNYRSCEDILEALKPFLNKNKATVILSDSIEFINDRHYVKAVASFIDIETGDTLTASAFAREALSKKGADESQITGTASSYARKYALNGLFLIDDTKDADTDENKIEADERAKSEKLATEAQIEELIEHVNAKGKGINGILTKYKVNDLSELTQSQIKHCINLIQMVK